MKLKLERPLIFIDLEGTGTDPDTDHIVELCMIRFSPEGGREMFLERVNPGVPIPPEASAVHGIYDDDVREKPFFRVLAPKVQAFADGCDFAGYNILRYDLPMLHKEMARSGLDLRLSERRLVDVMRIYHKKEPRDLSAAFRFYCGKELRGAHGARADTEAAVEVLLAQLEKYGDLPADVEGLHEYCSARDQRFVDASGRFIWKYGTAHFNFGRFKGQSLEQVARQNPEYLIWLLEEGKLAEEAWSICRNALEGDFPKK